MTWSTTKLKWAATTTAGGTPSVSDESFWATGEDGLPWVTIGDMSGRTSVSSTGRRVSSQGIAAARLPRGRPGTLLLSMYASIGHTAFLEMTSSWNQAILGIEPSNAYEPRFIKYALDALKPTLTEYANSNTQANLNAEQVGNLAIPAPPLKDQLRVADFLDTETARIDRLIVATRRQSDLLDDRLVETFREMTTTGGSEETAATGVPWMPRMNPARKLMKIGQNFRASSGTTPRTSNAAYFGGDTYWINTGDLRDGTVESPRKTVTDLALADCPTLKVYRPGSLVVAMYGATTGRVGILGTPACVNQACCVLTELGPLSALYAFFWFRGHREEILRLASGGGQPNISQDLVRSLRVPAPRSRQEQEEIVARAAAAESAVSRQRELLTRRATLLAERRQALITAAVTGRFDVSTADGRNATDGEQA